MAVVEELSAETGLEVGRGGKLDGTMPDWGGC